MFLAMLGLSFVWSLDLMLPVSVLGRVEERLQTVCAVDSQRSFGVS
jgi:hypothetical protein